ncbi:MAG: hypothetical protein A3H93_09135 [Rhodocyclales bacterium RIFCSPLOWO2_02_FULL_63_24]|nr:MAG: hypothetical protein A3H93_09135 [Rhodocyclales bacterium RIFCSPLOWO2_02_FULL_63_24]
MNQEEKFSGVAGDELELLEALADTVAAELVAAGIGDEQAAEIGVKVMDRMRKDWGGDSFYFPKGCAIDIARRDLEIYEKFDGRNHTELGREYDLSVIHIYRIVKAVGAEMMKRRQPALF